MCLTWTFRRNKETLKIKSKTIINQFLNLNSFLTPKILLKKISAVFKWAKTGTISHRSIFLRVDFKKILCKKNMKMKRAQRNSLMYLKKRKVSKRRTWQIKHLMMFKITESTFQQKLTNLSTSILIVLTQMLIKWAATKRIALKFNNL